MKQRMKAEKMLLGILLSVVMILGLVPGMSLTALAADPNVAISPTNGEVSDGTKRRLMALIIMCLRLHQNKDIHLKSGHLQALLVLKILCA